MPFTKTGPNEYTSPRGKKLTRKQVNAYYARQGSKNPNTRRNRELRKRRR